MFLPAFNGIKSFRVKLFQFFVASLYMSIFLESKFIIFAVNDISMVKKEKLLITDKSGL